MPVSEDAAHDGYNCSTVPADPSQLWSVTLDGPASYPVIAGGRVFVTTGSPSGSGADLYALSATTGKTIWGPIALSGTYEYFPLAFGGSVESTITLPSLPGGGGEYSGTPADLGAGNNILVVPTGDTVTAFG